MNKDWSDSAKHPAFSTVFFLDSNLLVHLIEETHPALTYFVNYLNKSDFARLISSEYAIFEFTQARKREHYFKLAATKYKKTPRNKINFGEMLKDFVSKEFDIKLIPYAEVHSIIRRRVRADEQKLLTHFGIVCSECILHSKQLNPSLDICLSSKVSNKDALILVSSTSGSSKKVILLTKDSDFAKFGAEPNVLKIMKNHGLEMPNIQDVRKLKLFSKQSSEMKLVSAVKSDNDWRKIYKQIPDILLNQIKLNNSQNYLGETVLPNNNLNDHVYFKLSSAREVPRNIVLTILAKDLSFVYSTKKKVDLLYSWNGTAIPLNTTNVNGSIINFFMPLKNEHLPRANNIIAELRRPGNHIYVHPDQ
jgi:hypothetical protein